MTTLFVLIMIAEVFFYYSVIAEKIYDGQEMQRANREMLQVLAEDIRETAVLNKSFSDWFIAELKSVRTDVDQLRKSVR